MAGGDLPTSTKQGQWEENPPALTSSSHTQPPRAQYLLDKAAGASEMGSAGYLFS